MDAETIAASLTKGLRVRGYMDNGDEVVFSVEKPCGTAGFIGRCVSASPGVICKPGYIPLEAVHADDQEQIRTILKGQTDGE